MKGQKFLTDRELAIISAAATMVTRKQDEDSDLVYLASYLWEVVNRHDNKQRRRNVINEEQNLNLRTL